MCWMCDQDKSLLAQEWIGAARFGAMTGVHVQKDTDARYALTDAFPADGVGDKVAVAGPTATDIALTSLIIDEIPDDTSTTVTITVGGPRLVSTLNTPGDFDFVKVEFQAGVTYDIGMYAKTNGPSGVPLADAFIEIYDSAGNKLAIADGGATTTYNNINSGLDVLYSFTAETSGTYYINARAFDNEPLDGDTGEAVGDYELFARVSSYTPYYDLNSPLHTLDWGTQFDGTSRNPDGAEGPRATGNELEGKIGGKNVIYVYFARQGDIFVDNSANPLNLTTTMVAKGLQPWERQAFEDVFAEYEKVADIDYVETEDRWAADIVVVTYDGTPGRASPSLLGRMSPPDTPSEGQTEYNAGDYRWTQEGLAPGGMYFGTLIHEFGHGHGMSHPHDNGGKSSVMPDGDTESGYVEETEPFVYTLGDFDLNQGVYTMMSYMDGWQLSPYGQPSSSAGYGFIGSLMAFDIAVIQDKYGVNEEWATGNDTYRLSDENVTAQFDANGNQTRDATSYRSIWDAGGIDAIVYSGARDANIDLRPATLKYEEGGGGWISYAYGIHGGFTVANGVTIENASSGSGNDKLTGNDAANTLSSGAGNDVIVGNGGNDLMDGGAGNDSMSGGTGDDIYYVDSGDTVIELPNEGWDAVYASGSFRLAAGSNVEVLATRNYALTDSLDLTGNEANNTITGNNGANALNGGGGDDTLNGLDGNDRLDGGSGRDSMVGGRGNDTYLVDNAGDRVTEAAGEGLDSVYASTSYTLAAGVEAEVLATVNYLSTDALALTGNEYNNAITGNEGANTLVGGGGGDTLRGLGGNDLLDGGAGKDSLEGGAGSDTFRFSSASDSAVGSIDRIGDFLSGQDKIDLSAIDANTNTIANDAFTFIGSNAFTGVAGQLRAMQVSGALWQVQGDVNGDGVADLLVEVVMQSGLPILGSDFIP